MRDNASPHVFLQPGRLPAGGSRSPLRRLTVQLAVAAVGLIVVAFTGTPRASADSTSFSLSGIVSSSGGPLSGICVSANANDPLGSYILVATTDSTGHFQIPSILPGDYFYVEFNSDLCGFPVNSSYLSPVFYGGGALFYAGVGDALDASIILGPPATISGTVRDSFGPVSGICVGATGTFATTDSGGNYTLTNLIPGVSYDVEFNISSARDQVTRSIRATSTTKPASPREQPIPPPRLRWPLLPLGSTSPLSRSPGPSSKGLPSLE
jgi:hypothetical protein